MGLISERSPGNSMWKQANWIYLFTMFAVHIKTHCIILHHILTTCNINEHAYVDTEEYLPVIILLSLNA